VIAVAASGELSTNEALAMARLIEKFVEVEQTRFFLAAGVL
jgi:hypothetical protein